MAPGIPDTGIKMGPMIIPSINHTDRPNPIAGGRRQGPLPRRSRCAPHLRRRRSGRLSRPCQNRMPARPDHDLRFFRWRQPVRALEEGKPALQTSRPTGQRARFGSAVASGALWRLTAAPGFTGGGGVACRQRAQQDLWILGQQGNGYPLASQRRPGFRISEGT